MYTSKEDQQAWKTGIFSYQKQKRTKKPFGKQFSPSKQIITETMVKERDSKFHPLLQVYKNPIDQIKKQQNDQQMINSRLLKHSSLHHKYDKDYDIINLHANSPDSKQYKEKIPKSQAPVRNIYNVVNNQKLPDFHFADRKMKLPIQHPFKKLDKNPRDYDIISNNYLSQNQQRKMLDVKNEQNKIMNKYKRSKVYDSIYGRYYNQNKQEQYQQYLKKAELEHGKDYQTKHFPPSYVHRQPLILDHSKPYSSVLQAYDQKRANAKKRYQMKYLIQDEYNKRNEQFNQKRESIIRNRVHNSRLMQHMGRQFDLINSNKFSPERSQELYNKKLVQSTWDRLAQSNSNLQPQYSSHVPIKTSGFSQY